VRGDLRPPEVWNALSGIEILRGYLDGDFGDFPLSLLFGSSLVHAGDGEVSVEMEATPWHCTGGGTVYGGLLALQRSRRWKAPCSRPCPQARSTRLST
jgi:hypothetical protein